MAKTALAQGRLEEGLKDKKPLYTPAEAKAEAERCLYCSDAPCIQACPTAIDIPTFIKKIATGNVRGSAKTIFTQNLLGHSCARVCPVEVLCVGSCVYTGWGRDPIQIGRLQRYATETATKDGDGLLEVKPAGEGAKKVACIGGGPASLAFAGTLAQAGHRAVVFEQRPVPGGLNATGIAPYKLKAKDALHEVHWVQQLGVEVQTGVEVGKQVKVERLLQDYDAVFVGVGLGPDTELGLKGEQGAGVIGAIRWIERMKLDPKAARPKGRVMVVGGGNTAIDVARECAQLGADDVVMVYRRTEAEMSGYRHELEGARKEGVRLVTERVPVAFVRNAKGKLTHVKLAATKKGKPVKGTEEKVPVDLVVVAIGQFKLKALLGAIPGVELDAKGRVVVDEATKQTNNPKVFAGGDCINGGKEVVNAVADGRDAARFLLSQWGA